MLYCSNPNCPNSFNSDTNKFCQSCGTLLSPLLRSRYRVLRQLGVGGFGKTYQAEDTDRMDDPCVIKQFVPQVEGTAALEKATELFKQEAKRLYELGDHPQIPRLIAYFEQDKRLYLVQELIAGQTLLEELQEQGAFNEPKIRDILLELLPVLQFIHQRNVIHRDIKPDNIMRRLPQFPAKRGLIQGISSDLVLIDFGVSKQVSTTALKTAGTMVGTMGYAPVEQMRGKVYPASDLYSLGVTCIRLMTGCLPQSNDADEIYDAINGRWVWRQKLPPGISISNELGLILDKLTQDYLKERYQTADEVLQDMVPQSLSPTILNPPSPTPLPSPNPTPNPTLLVSAKGVDYKKLQQLLLDHQWQEADQETTDQILKIVGKTKRGYLLDQDFSQFPCEDILTLDQLWLQYSNRHFGLSVQKQIWLEEAGQANHFNLKIWQQFADRVGWRANNDWLYYYDLNFTDKAPRGHLPIIGLGKWENKLGKWLFTGEGLHYVGCIHGLVNRMIQCKI